MKTIQYVQKVEEILRKDYDHEIPDKPRSAEFNRVIKAMLKDMFPECTIIPTKGAWCSASGFIIDPEDGKCAFYSFQDYRYGNWKQRILIRTAKNEKDYTGGPNRYADLTQDINDLYLGIMRLWHRGLM